MDEKSDKIFPRNLTARATYQAPGNPVVTRLEDAVGNCYPGLEIDVRNFDRRFFPGLVFEFVARNDNTASYKEPNRYGAWLNYVDYLLDPDLQAETPEAKKLLYAIMMKEGTLNAARDWYLEWVEQGGKRISMRDSNPDGAQYPLDGLYAWRLLRGLAQGPLTIALKRRSDTSDDGLITFHGWRRRFTDETTGVISAAFLPGELLQSLCSPWQHDFRDCACLYWASNHPDVVFAEVAPGEETLPDGSAADPQEHNLRVDWLRADRSKEATAAAGNTIAKNRPYQFDHFQINQEWQRLNVVLENREIDSTFIPVESEQAPHFDTPEQLAHELRETLGPMELALALEYLYARFSLVSPEMAEKSDFGTLRDDVLSARNYLILVASSEMTHLRMVNEMLWILYDAKLIGSYDPVLTPAKKLPSVKGGLRDRALRPLTPRVLDEFVRIERPKNFLDRAYVKVIATLRSDKRYPPSTIELAERIDNDGLNHFEKFSEIQVSFRAYAATGSSHPYLRDLTTGDADSAKEALDLYHEIVAGLGAAYRDYAHNRYDQGAPQVKAARTKMKELLDVGEALAAKGIGIPFW
jgi:hypothetical protein